MTKQELRSLFLQKRQSLNEAEYLLLNRQLCDVFFTAVDLSFINVLHCFLPIPEKKEPDTWLIIDRLQREFPHIRLVVPRVNTQRNELSHFLFEGPGKLKTSRWGVPEPTDGISVEVEKIDMVLVPLLAFDRHGHRVGYGKGFYDRFLSICRPTTKRIGISFFGPVEKINSGRADVKLSGCVTPSEFFQFPA